MPELATSPHAASLRDNGAAAQKPQDGPGRPRHVRVAIIGAGFGGLGMAIRLKREGIEDFVVLERAAEVGGTWWANDYPGAACDVPSRLYSFSFAANPEWSRSFSPQDEILAYLRDCSLRFGVRSHIRFGCEVLDAAWEEDRQRWRVRMGDGSELTADVLVSATGGLSDPKLPPIAGAERFSGAVFHSAAWNHEHDLTGERVAVVGTGASAIQIVPAIQAHVAALKVFQRTPAWVIPRTDRRFSRLERWIYRRIPAAERLARSAIYWGREGYVLGFRRPRRMRAVEHLARWHLRRQVPDPELRAKLTPDYTIGCKRILISNDFYPAVSKQNADVITSPIVEIRERSIVTADGAEHEVDTIVFATGFQVMPPPIVERLRGRGGTTLGESWRERGMQAFRGTAVAGFPNLFFIVGPNTGLGHTSIVCVIEAQIAYVLDALRVMERERIGAVEPRAEAQERFNRAVQRSLEGTVWNAGGCASWYLDENGRNTTLWPTFTFTLRRRLERFDLEAYDSEAAHERQSLPA